MWGSGAMGWVGWMVMTLAMIGFWALVAFGIAALFRTGSAPPPADPLRVLDDRFARGEIDADEYQARRRALRPHR
ncbi:SHOCT domain-containing protein [Rhodococcus sp. 14C212]|uniref:SHOCT domain-containing protein n=1 Tax=Rhodococcus sp. 14C212 TaxID=2711209 RepID=UPI0013EB38EC|nr:SHOCT domain-containing protein [Rhodococcus sp. 14C212]NGP08746.1 SHOCT domain-containing protein [Rhodococcus sp. 14C212]